MENPELLLDAINGLGSVSCSSVGSMVTREGDVEDGNGEEKRMGEKNTRTKLPPYRFNGGNSRHRFVCLPLGRNHPDR
jgi:hypothetical protein